LLRSRRAQQQQARVCLISVWCMHLSSALKLIYRAACHKRAAYMVESRRPAKSMAPRCAAVNVHRVQSRLHAVSAAADPGSARCRLSFRGGIQDIHLRRTHCSKLPFATSCRTAGRQHSCSSSWMVQHQQFGPRSCIVNAGGDAVGPLFLYHWSPISAPPTVIPPGLTMPVFRGHRQFELHVALLCWASAIVSQASF
jgi:hypothetical protein